MLHNCLESNILLFRFLVDSAFLRFTFLLLAAALGLTSATAATLQEAVECRPGSFSAEEGEAWDEDVPWSKEKLNLPVNCRSRARNERGPGATEAFVGADAFAAEN